jgi:hypothetical protein
MGPTANLYIQWKPLNVITLGQSKSDNINRLLLISSLQQMGRVECDHIKRLITLTSDNIKRLSLYNIPYRNTKNVRNTIFDFEDRRSTVQS